MVNQVRGITQFLSTAIKVKTVRGILLPDGDNLLFESRHYGINYFHVLIRVALHLKWGCGYTWTVFHDSNTVDKAKTTGKNASLCFRFDFFAEVGYSLTKPTQSYNFSGSDETRMRLSVRLINITIGILKLSPQTCLRKMREICRRSIYARNFMDNFLKQQKHPKPNETP